MRPLRILVTGEPVESVVKTQGNFTKLIQRAVGEGWAGPWEEVDCRTVDAELGKGEAAGVIVTGSPASVLERAPWMLRVEEYLRTSAERGVPILGLCFGHQLLAQAFGGEVAINPAGREMGTVEVQLLKSDPLLDEQVLPFLVNMTHVDSVLRLPEKAEVLARTSKDAHAAVRFRERVWGVQFHPEISGDVMAAYVQARWNILLAEGHDPAAILAGARDAPAGSSVLRRFVALLSTASLG